MSKVPLRVDGVPAAGACQAGKDRRRRTTSLVANEQTVFPIKTDSLHGPGDPLLLAAQQLYDLLSHLHSPKPSEKAALAPRVKQLTSAVTILVNARFNSAPADSPLNQLSIREREILILFASGKSTKEAAVFCDIFVKTAESHRRNIMQKIGADSIAELTRYAIRNGLIEV